MQCIKNITLSLWFIFLNKIGDVLRVKNMPFFIQMKLFHLSVTSHKRSTSLSCATM